MPVKYSSDNFTKKKPIWMDLNSTTSKTKFRCLLKIKAIITILGTVLVVYEDSVY